MLNSMTTSFVARLKRNDQAAWFELWETFGPVLRSQLMKWGKGRVGSQTVQDLSQETLAALSDSIERYDPSRGARFSTWLLAIAKHVLGDEMDKRGAQKRGSSKIAASFDDAWMAASPVAGADAQYEAAMFRAKVEASIRLVEKSSDFTDFEIYRMRVLDGRSGKDVASALGVSEPTISRRLAKVRQSLRSKLADVIAMYSFTRDELEEAARNGLRVNPSNGTMGSDPSCPEPTAADDQNFDDCIAEIYHRQLELRQQDQVRSLE